MKPLNHITPPIDCTGCSLCANVCSRNAISMQWNNEGFLVPLVDISSCVNCGLCVKQCIALAEKPTYTDDIDSVVSYGGWNKDKDIHQKSSSGGVFTALARKAINEGGCVFGVVWQDKLTAVFSKAETQEQLSPMLGSKYTQAKPNYVYREVKAELNSGRLVLFSGTPCQVHALKKYLRKPYDNLLTVDIVCHGTPSHLILEKYIKEEETRTGKTIDHISFRDKKDEWQRYHVTRHYTDGSHASEAFPVDIYMNMFLCDKALNKVCYNCPYAHIPRQGDITLGDYWGVEKHHSDWPMKLGISAILANTPKGNTYLQDLSNMIDLRLEVPGNICSAQPASFIRPKKRLPKDRDLMFSKMPIWSLEEIRKKIVNTTSIGPFRLRTRGHLYRAITFLPRAIRYLKRRLGK